MDMIFVIVLSFVGGIVFQWIVRTRIQLRRSRESDQKHSMVQETSETRASVGIVIVISLLIAISSWFLEYYATQNNLSPILQQLAASIFGLSAAGFLGQIIFEVMLRKQLLDQTSRVLAEIILMKRETIQALFSRQRINEIIKLCLQILTSSETFGTALSDLLQPYLEARTRRQVRLNFEDDISFFPYKDLDPLSDEYYLVNEVLHFRTRPPNSDFRVGCAPDEEKLYQLFEDSTCIYRWAMFGAQVDFEKIVIRKEMFKVEVFMNDEPCPIKHSGATDRGYEIEFKNPLLTETVGGSDLMQDTVQLKLKVTTVHPKSKHFLSVHLAYPTDQARIHFAFGDAEIHNVNLIHFFTTSKVPRIDYALNPDGQARRISVVVQGTRWIFPDEGVVFLWE